MLWNHLTVLFRRIQFSMSQQSEPGSNSNEGVLGIPQSSSITGTTPSDSLVSFLGMRGGVYPTAEMSQYILHPQPTGPVILRTLIGGILSLCRDAVGVFYSPSQLGQSYPELLLQGNLTPLQRSSHIQDTLGWGCLTLLQRCSRCILHTQPTGPVILRTLIGGILSLCRDAVGVFYSPSWLGQSYPGFSLRGNLTPLLRSSQCILQPTQATRPNFFEEKQDYASSTPFIQFIFLQWGIIIIIIHIIYIS